MPLNYTQIQQFNGGGTDQFGTSVAISTDGLTALMGSPFSVGKNGDNEGSVYVYTRSNTDTTWTFQAVLRADDGATDDRFGWSVALSANGNIALIGAIGVDGSSSSYDHGAAYIFRRSGSTWNQQQKIIDPTNRANDVFGYAVALSADGVVAAITSGMTVDQNFSNIVISRTVGSAFLYVFSVDSWKLSAHFSPSDNNGSIFDTGFGGSIALSGDGKKVIVGAPKQDRGAGKVYSYVRTDEGSLISSQTLVAFDRNIYDSFGISVTMSQDGDTALVGAEGVDASASSYDHGVVYAFKRATGGFFDSIQPRLMAADHAPNDLFGHNVRLSKDGSTAIIGAYGFDSSNISTDVGAAYIFSQSSGLWIQQQKILANNGVPNALFGNAVAISGDGGRVLIGAFHRTGNAGAAYFFDLSGFKITSTQSVDGVKGSSFPNFNITIQNAAALTITQLNISLSSGSLPPGLSIVSPNTTPIINNSSNTFNILSGTPNTVGAYSQTFLVTDQSGNTDTFSSTINIIPIAVAGSDQQLVAAISTTLTGNDPSPGTGVWTVTGPNTPSFSSSNTIATPTVNGLINGTYTFTWTISSRHAVSSANVSVSVISPNAGADQFFVTPHTSITLAASPVPPPATGSWSQVAGAAATITTPSSPNSTVTGLTVGTYTFRWSVAAAFDDMIVTIIPVAAAGPDQTPFLTSATLAANNPFPGKGTWSQISGPNTAKIAEKHNSTTKVSSLNEGTYTFRWTITAGDAISFDDMLITHVSSTDLLVTIKASSDFILAGQQNIISITAKNNSSSVSFSDVTVFFELPIGVNFVSQSGGGGNYTFGTGFWSVGFMPPNTSATKNLTLQYSSSGTKSLTGYISAAVITLDPNSDNNSSTVLVNVKPAVNLQLLSLVTSPQNILVGGSDVLTATVYNSGPSNIPKATLDLGFSTNVSSRLGKKFSLGMIPSGSTIAKSTTLTYTQPGIELISGTVTAGYFSLNSSFFSDLGQKYRITSNITGPRSVIEVNLNGGGQKLIAVSNQGNATITFYTFSSDSWIQHSTIATGSFFSGPARLLYAKINGLYLLGIANYGTQSVNFYQYSDIMWVAQPAYTLTLGAGSYPGGLVYDNISGSDMLGVTDFSLNAVYFYKPTPSGSWMPQPSFTINTGLSYPYALIYQNFSGLKLLGVTNNTGGNTTFYEASSSDWKQRTEYTINMANPTGIVYLPDLNIMGLAHDSPNLVTFYEPNNIGGGFTQDSSPGGVILEDLSTPVGLVYTTINGDNVLGVANVNTNNVAFYTPILSNIDINISDNFFLTNTNVYPLANAGSDQFLPTGNMTTLAGNSPLPGTGAWTQILGPAIATITNPSLPNTSITNLVLGTYTFRWTITGGGLTTSDEVLVQVRSANLSVTITPDITSLTPSNANIVTLTARNDGPNAVSDAVVNFPLPAGVSLIFELFGYGTYTPPNWNIGPLNVSDSTTKLLFLRYNTPGIKPLSATISSIIGDPNTSNNTSTAIVTVRDVLLANVQIVPNPVQINSSFNVIFDGVLVDGSNTLRTTFTWQGSDIVSDFPQGTGLSYTLPTPMSGANYPLTITIQDAFHLGFNKTFTAIVFVQIPPQTQLVVDNLYFIFLIYFLFYMWVLILAWWRYALDNS